MVLEDDAGFMILDKNFIIVNEKTTENTFKLDRND